MKSLFLPLFLASVCLVITSCSKNETVIPGQKIILPEEVSYSSLPASSFVKHKPGLLKAEFLTSNSAKREGMTIVYNDTKTRPDAEFVSIDPRRGASKLLTYAIGTELTKDFNISSGSVHNAIDNAIKSWTKASHNKIQMQKVFTTENLGYVSGMLGFGGYEFNIADIQEAGFLPGEFFNQLTPGGGDFVLAVTFTFIYFDENGLPTDIDKNGVNDVAFRETYYNDNFNWRISHSADYDIETVALHETGHALGLSHFGKGILCKDGKIRFSPRAVMNAVYVTPLRQPKEEDKTFLMSVWRNWNK